MVLVWQHPVFSNPTLLHFALTNVNFCCLLQAHCLIQPAHHAPFVTAAAMTPEAVWPRHCCPPLLLQQGKEQNLPSGKKEMGKSEVVLLFLLSLSHLSPQHHAQGVSVALHADALGS